ncbi:hypothetical protein [Nocardia sp. NPDC050413]|uniref:hypothetical protein n=1 Tax=Nocardia sp. NPDC050413 TaxID=3155784 RepID=UPI0033C900CD
MTNPWQWTGSNPYYSTAFQILDLDPTAGPSVARARIAARRKRIAFDPGRFPLFGAVLTVAQVNAADEQLGSPETRLAAELLTHRPVPAESEVAELAELQQLADELDAAVARDAEDAAEAVPGAVPGLNYQVLPKLLPPALGPELHALR